MILLWAVASLLDSFALRDGDRIVVVGDSITVEGHTVRILENFVRTRFPRWNIIVRNAGINGQTARGGLAFLESDVLVWKPTVVIVNYGMNDGRSADGVERYREGVTAYLDRLGAAGVRAVLCSNSPLDLGDEPGKYTDFNRNFDRMATFAEGLARERGLLFADPFHFCHSLWGENRRRERPVPVSDQTLAKHPSDSVHARAPGQLTMAFAILKALRAPEEVSHAAVDASGGPAETRRCEVREFRKAGEGVSFVRTDEASPCYLDDRAAPGLELVPFQDELNRMTLRVTGLAAGIYELLIDAKVCGRYTGGELAAGINLSRNRQSPVFEPGRRVADLVSRQGQETYRAREVRSFRPPPWLAIPDLEKQKEAEFARRLPALERRDAEIAAAAAPRPQRYEIRRVEEKR